MKQWTERLRLVWPFFKDVAFGILLWALITTGVGEARRVPSESMEPTIQIGDRVWTDKLWLRFSEVERGDIVVFDPPFESPDPYIKRVIGLSGDRVQVRSGKVYINGGQISEPYLAEATLYDYGPVVVPEGQYLVLGDNRNRSYDSHLWGFLDGERIKSRAVYRFWPPSRIGPIK